MGTQRTMSRIVCLSTKCSERAPIGHSETSFSLLPAGGYACGFDESGTSVSRGRISRMGMVVGGIQPVIRGHREHPP